MAQFRFPRMGHLLTPATGANPFIRTDTVDDR